MTVTEITLASLTTGTLNGTGVFDALMRAAKVHLDAEFDKNRIRGPEYSTVYLGQLESSMRTALDFLTQQQKITLEAKLLDLQVKVAEVGLLKANVELEIAKEQALTAVVQRELLVQQVLNAKVEEDVLKGQVCKLKAEYDLTMKNVEKAGAEVTLLVQKTATEKAQILGLGVDDDSVIGRQKRLYLAQTEGFARDAEQKAARMYIDSWSARRMTDEATQANSTNGLDDVTMGAVLAKVRQGVGIPT